MGESGQTAWKKSRRCRQAVPTEGERKRVGKPAGLEAAQGAEGWRRGSRGCRLRASGFPRPRVGWPAGWAKGQKPLRDQLLGVPFAGTKRGALFRAPWVLPRGPYAVVSHESPSPWLPNLTPGPEPLGSRRRVRKNGLPLPVPLTIPHRPLIPEPAHLPADALLPAPSPPRGPTAALTYARLRAMRRCMGVAILARRTPAALGFGKLLGGGGDFEPLWLRAWAEPGGPRGSRGTFWSKLGVWVSSWRRRIEAFVRPVQDSEGWVHVNWLER